MSTLARLNLVKKNNQKHYSSGGCIVEINNNSPNATKLYFACELNFKYGLSLV